QVQDLGFTEIKLAGFNLLPFYLSLEEFEGFLSGHRATLQRYAEAAREFIQNQRNFFLYKGNPAPPDSRYRKHVAAKIEIRENALRVAANHPFIVHATATNEGRAVWLPPGAGLGGVFLGVHVADREGKILRKNWRWEPLTSDEGPPIQ